MRKIERGERNVTLLNLDKIAAALNGLEEQPPGDMSQGHVRAFQFGSQTAQGRTIGKDRGSPGALGRDAHGSARIGAKLGSSLVGAPVRVVPLDAGVRADFGGSFKVSEVRSPKK
jgi:hypothetical protein